MAKEQFDFSFSKHEEALLTKFKNLLKLEHKDTFSSDDFRQYGLHTMWPQKEWKWRVGSLFAKAVHHHRIVHTGEWIRSVLPKNNQRKIREYEWNQR